MEFRKRLTLEAVIEAADPHTADAVMAELIKELLPTLRERCTVEGSGITGAYKGELHLTAKVQRVNGKKLKAA